jgi:hypothetical protein
LTRVTAWAVSWAAVGITVVMISATIYHLARGENSSAAITFVLLTMATFVAYMRVGACCRSRHEDASRDGYPVALRRA